MYHAIEMDEPGAHPSDQNNNCHRAYSGSRQDYLDIMDYFDIDDSRSFEHDHNGLLNLLYNFDDHRLNHLRDLDDQYFVYW